MIENISSSIVPAIGEAPAESLPYGWLDPNWFEYHQEFSITVSAGPDRPTETLLIGRVADQSALIGTLSTLHHFGLTLIFVQLVESERTPLESKETVSNL